MSYHSNMSGSGYSPYGETRPQVNPQQQPHYSQSFPSHSMSTSSQNLSPHSGSIMFGSPGAGLDPLFDQTPTLDNMTVPLDIPELESVPNRSNDGSPWAGMAYIPPASNNAHHSFDASYQPYYNGTMSATPTHSHYEPSFYGEETYNETPNTSAPPSQSHFGSEFDFSQQTRPHHEYATDPRKTVKAASEISTTTNGSRKRHATEHPIKCDQCAQECRTESELKKHRAKHEKSHTCPLPKCGHGGAGNGFTTSNDLERHMGSKHDIFLPGSKLKVYKCQARGCEGKRKLWPRFDNFKQHIERMHAGCDVDEIIRRSKRDAPLTPESYHYHDIIKQRDSASSVRRGSSPTAAQTPPSGPQSVRAQHSPSMSATQIGTSSSSLAPGLPRPGLMASTSSSTGHLSVPMGRRRSTGSRSSLASAPSTRVARSATQGGHARPALQHLSTDLSGSTPHIILSPSPSTDERALENEARLRALTQQIASAQGDPKKIFESLRTYLPSPASTTDRRGSELSDAETPSVSEDPASGDVQPTAPETSATMISCRAEGCDKKFSRECDMNKHATRHQKPFGCTFDGCSKKFGSKNDWKRHENSQHYQNECWRCPLWRKSKQSKAGSGAAPSVKEQCAEIHFKHDDFESHIRLEHSFEVQKHGKNHAAEWMQETCRASRIGANGQHSFWCGFCRAIVPLQDEELKAWDERFNHIGEHFRTRSIDEWFMCGEVRMTKGQEKGVGAVGESEAAEVDGASRKGPRMMCCPSCRMGPYNLSSHASCPDCGCHFPAEST